ncbi:hypothetical protein MN116_004675 [Schistosoma mekongi]|uniref:DRBM domain-containing protein n=1 Tax=Schistosoma mekongi TaxID=38744 RepID=A0AAE1ZCG3_SCHME|nr:hypothetical protein MN116_004675 [Schistosoma mekongi]
MSEISTHRTPISILQEVCVKKGITPLYELVSSEGPIHEPLYVFLCTAGPFSATSKGASKKRAKHQASYLILLKMLNSRLLTETEKYALRDIHIAAVNVLGSDFMDSLDDVELDGLPNRIKQEEEGNFVGRLQELCQKNIWPPPSYEFLTIQSTPSGNEYGCKVRLWKWTHTGKRKVLYEYVTGFGNSKKSAKRRAALGLLDSIIKNNLTIPQEALDDMEEETLSLLNKDDQSNVKESKSESEAATRITSKALRGLWNGKGCKVKVPPINTTDKMDNPCEYLEEICDCAKITVVYTYVAVNNQEMICFAELSTMPPHVIKSQLSSNLASARKDAARRCILFLKAMSSSTPCLNYSEWFTAPLNNNNFQHI